MTEKYIQAMMVWPGDRPCMTYLLDDRRFLDFAVGLGSDFGGEAAVMKLSDTAAILYNNEALICELRGNRRIGKKLLAGVFYVVGVGNGKLVDLPFKEMELYYERFWEPECYTEADVKEAYKAELFKGIDLN